MKIWATKKRRRRARVAVEWEGTWRKEARVSTLKGEDFRL
jgi:hypothetical protein